MQHSSKTVRLTITILLIVFSVVTIFASPLIVKKVLPEIINSQIARFEKMSASDKPEEVQKAKLIEDTPYLVSFFYPFWMALAMFGGVVAIVISRAFYRGEGWAKGVGLLATAMPSMAGAYMLIPWINFIGFDKGSPLPIYISLLGLIPFFAILLAEESGTQTKVVNFIVFLLLGVTGAHSFTIGHASLRFQWMHPARPLWPEGTWVLWLSTQFLWLGTISLALAIFFLGIRKKAGWYLGLIGGIVVMIAGYWTHLIRGTTSDYILAGTFGLIIVIVFLLPFFKNKLFDDA
jgi:hypothetical protein